MSKELPNSLGVTNTKLAACLEALGFLDWTADCVQSAKGGPMRVQFVFRDVCSRPEFAGRVSLADARAFESGRLQIAQPMHPLCVMMRGQGNYDKLLEARKTGAPLRLVGRAGGCMTTLEFGPLDTSFLAPSVPFEKTEDLALTAALAGVGLPLLRIEGRPPLQRFHIAQAGYYLEGDKTSPQESLRLGRLEKTSDLMSRSPTREDPLRLALEITSPWHPVVLIYDALAARARFKARLEKVTPLLLIPGPGLRAALVTMNATGRVMEKANQHVRAPGLKW